MQSSFFNSSGVHRFFHSCLLRLKSLQAPQSLKKNGLLVAVMTHTPPARASQV